MKLVLVVTVYMSRSFCLLHAPGVNLILFFTPQNLFNKSISNAFEVQSISFKMYVYNQSFETISKLSMLFSA